MTASEQARAFLIMAFRKFNGRGPIPSEQRNLNEIVPDLTPIYERAQRFEEVASALNPVRQDDAAWALGRDLSEPGVAATQIEKTRERTGALRERAERAEADVARLSAAFAAQDATVLQYMEERNAVRADVARLREALTDSTRYCSGAFPCEASTAAAYEERRANNAEANVMLLRAAAVKAKNVFSWWWSTTLNRIREAIQALDDALAATEPKSRG